MTDKYADLRAALDALKPGNADAMLAYRVASDPETILALLDERDRLQAVLAELIACDDLKRRIAVESATMIPETGDDFAELDRLMSDLARRQPKAWREARTALTPQEQRCASRLT
ncbi:hypothetical protein ACSBPU_13105 [Parapusillimonas sp. JC17]|uniref:hypothetical protein n=1 Tax=Parapusillimonas sp. JC17 TaxID=3445768 RepID=UPI003FA1123A